MALPVQNNINRPVPYLSTSNSSSQQRSEESKELDEVVSSVNLAKIIFIFFGCLSTAMVSLIGEYLLKNTVKQIQDLIIEVMDNQGLLKNISSEDILNISNQMKLIRIKANSLRVSIFKLDKSSAVVFLETSSSGKYSLANSPPVARQFFDIAVLPMIESNQNYSYCGNNGSICQTWLAQRGTGRYAIRLFSYKTFTGFILIEWKLSIIDRFIKNDDGSENYKKELDSLALMIIDAIKDKK